MNADDHDVGYDLVISHNKRAFCGGNWVGGMLNGHRFEALVFSEHAENPEWEIGESKISKLWIQRLSDKRAVFTWDRGADVPAADDMTRAIVDFLAGGLADHIYS